MCIAIQNCTYGKSKHERKELHNQNHTFWRRLHFKRLMTPDKSLRSSGTESRVHENDLLLYRDTLDVLDTRDSQWQKLTYLAPSKTRQVSDVDVSYHPYVRFSLVAH